MENDDDLNSVNNSGTEDEDEEDDYTSLQAKTQKKISTKARKYDIDDDKINGSEMGSDSDRDRDSDKDSEKGDDEEEEEDDDENAEFEADFEANEMNAVDVKNRPSFLNLSDDEGDDADNEDDFDDDDDDDIDTNYLQKMDGTVKQNLISQFHPELHTHNTDEIDVLTRVVRNDSGIIIDPFHKTVPFITRYERARIIGERAKQLESGALPAIEVEPTIIDSYVIALKEFEQKKIPFIVKRPLPNGGCEYWKLADLEFI